MNPALITLATFVVGFPLLWVAICAFASSCGWGDLGRRFPRSDYQPAVEFGFRTVQVVAGWLPSNYGGCVTVGANVDGLFLRVFPLFRPFHPPLFIPWAAIESTVRHHWTGSTVDLKFPDEPGVTVKLSKATAERLADAAGRWPDRTG